MSRRQYDIISKHVLDQVLGIFQAREADFLGDEFGGYGNPRREEGLTAAVVASAMGWTTGVLGENGRFVPDVPRAERVIAKLMSENRLETVPSRRSPRKGRAPRACYATAGFREKLAAVRAQAA